MISQTSTPVIVCGAAGKMGREVIKTVANASDMTLLGAIECQPEYIGQDIGELIGSGPLEVPILNDLQGILVMAAQEKQPAVMVDFTHPDSVYENVRSAIAYGVRPVVDSLFIAAVVFRKRRILRAGRDYQIVQK